MEGLLVLRKTITLVSLCALKGLSGTQAEVSSVHPVVSALAQGNVSQLAELLKNPDNVNYTTADKNNLLHLWVQLAKNPPTFSWKAKEIALLQVISQAGVSYHTPNNRGSFPIMLAHELNIGMQRIGMMESYAQATLAPQSRKGEQFSTRLAQGCAISQWPVPEEQQELPLSTVYNMVLARDKRFFDQEHLDLVATYDPIARITNFLLMELLMNGEYEAAKWLIKEAGPQREKILSYGQRDQYGQRYFPVSALLLNGNFEGVKWLFSDESGLSEQEKEELLNQGVETQNGTLAPVLYVLALHRLWNDLSRLLSGQGGLNNDLKEALFTAEVIVPHQARYSVLTFLLINGEQARAQELVRADSAAAYKEFVLEDSFFGEDTDDPTKDDMERHLLLKILFENGQSGFVRWLLSNESGLSEEHKKQLLEWAVVGEHAHIPLLNWLVLNNRRGTIKQLFSPEWGLAESLRERLCSLNTVLPNENDDEIGLATTLIIDGKYDVLEWLFSDEVGLSEKEKGLLFEQAGVTAQRGSFVTSSIVFFLLFQQRYDGLKWLLSSERNFSPLVSNVLLSYGTRTVFSSGEGDILVTNSIPAALFLASDPSNSAPDMRERLKAFLSRGILSPSQREKLFSFGKVHRYENAQSVVESLGLVILSLAHGKEALQWLLRDLDLTEDERTFILTGVLSKNANGSIKGEIPMIDYLNSNGKPELARWLIQSGILTANKRRRTHFSASTSSDD